MGQSGYTLPVENATIRAPGNRVATDTGKVGVDRPGPVRLARGPEFLAHHVDDVRDVWKPRDLRGVEQVARNRLDAIPASRLGQGAGSENRATAITRRARPASRVARTASRARLGPIFPPAPRMRMSPSSTRIASITSGVGCDS